MSYRAYPVQKTEDKCEDYEVYVNGERVVLDTARVSADPINRRWPGHQRQIEQTELVNFLSLTVDGKTDFHVIPKKKSETAVIRPRGLGAEPKINPDGSIDFSIDRPAYFTLEPYGTNHALHIFADAEKKYDVDFSSPDVLYFGAGEHDLGKYEMKSGQTLFLDEGAVVYGTVSAFRAENLRILGHGILDNSKNKETILFEINAEGNNEDVGNAKRDFTFEVDCCKNVEIDGITVRDSLAYNMNFVSCENVRVNGVKLIGDWRYNSDGVHFANCRHCSLTNSFLRTYDDSVVIRGYEEAEMRKVTATDFYLTECRDVKVEGNVIWNDWSHVLMIGAATLGRQIADMLFENNAFIHVDGEIIGVYACDYADLRRFVFRNNSVEYDEVIKEPVIQNNDRETYASFPRDPEYTPWLISLRLLNHHEYSSKKENPMGLRGMAEDFLFDGLDVRGRQKIKLRFRGYDEAAPVRNVVIRALTKNGKKVPSEEIVTEKNDFAYGITMEQ